MCEEGGIVWGELPQRDAEMYGKNCLFLSVGVVQWEALLLSGWTSAGPSDSRNKVVSS